MPPSFRSNKFRRLWIMEIWNDLPSNRGNFEISIISNFVCQEKIILFYNVAILTLLFFVLEWDSIHLFGYEREQRSSGKSKTSLIPCPPVTFTNCVGLLEKKAVGHAVTNCVICWLYNPSFTVLTFAWICSIRHYLIR